MKTDETRPSERQIKCLRKVQLLAAGKSAVVNTNDAEECRDRRWIEPVPGGYVLTIEGRRVLKAFGSSD